MPGYNDLQFKKWTGNDLLLQYLTRKIEFRGVDRITQYYIYPTRTDDRVFDLEKPYSRHFNPTGTLNSVSQVDNVLTIVVHEEIGPAQSYEIAYHVSCEDVTVTSSTLPSWKVLIRKKWFWLAVLVVALAAYLF